MMLPLFLENMKKKKEDWRFIFLSVFKLDLPQGDCVYVSMDQAASQHV